MDTSEIDELKLRLKIEGALKCAPGVTLQDTLGAKTVQELKYIAKRFYLSGYSRLNKKGLIELIGQSLVNAEFLEGLIYILDPEDWSLFKTVAETECLQSDEYNIYGYRDLQELGYIQSYYDNNHFYYVMPREIRDVYAALKKDGIEERKARSDLLHNYATAAVRLYGVISQDDFVAIFNSQNTVPTDVDEVFTCLLRQITSVDSFYCFWDQYIVDDIFEENEYEDIARLLQVVEGKPRYIPDKQEFLKYTDLNYYEDTESTHAFLKYLQKELMMDEEDAEDILSEIQFICEKEMPFSECLDVILNYDVHIKRKQVQKLANLIDNVRNHIRLWSNNGHTNNEIFQIFGAIPQPGEKMKVKKVGRNDPCPCGSGKKYKKCCGR